MRHCPCIMAMVSCILAPQLGVSDERIERFNSDPDWDAYNNRSTAFSEKTIIQDFGYSRTRHAGGESVGEMGGTVNPAAEQAYYAKVIPTMSFNNKLWASGTLSCPGKKPFHALIGFFNAQTLNEWRTPNTIALRIQGRGEVFFAYVEYATSRWRAGGDSPGGFSTVSNPQTGGAEPRGFAANGVVHRWSITYDPHANEGHGSIIVTIDDEQAICHLDPGHKLDGATFNRFGLLNVMKHWDEPGEVWLDDIVVNGQPEDFSFDPGWDARRNRSTYVSRDVRPRFDFGYSPTNYAGGRKEGELGGLIFRGDIRDPNRMAFYGDRLERLTLAKPMRAAGTIALRRAVSDSGTLIGFFNSRESVATNASQDSAIPGSFLGLAIEGPSREGFLVYPVFRNSRDRNCRAESGPSILPDGSVHDWELEYRPKTRSDQAYVLVTLDGNRSRLPLAPQEVESSTAFDRFGIVTTWIDGNGQQIYFDDISYTYHQED